MKTIKLFTLIKYIVLFKLINWSALDDELNSHLL